MHARHRGPPNQDGSEVKELRRHAKTRGKKILTFFQDRGRCEKRKDLGGRLGSKQPPWVENIPSSVKGGGPDPKERREKKKRKETRTGC